MRPWVTIWHHEALHAETVVREEMFSKNLAMVATISIFAVVETSDVAAKCLMNFITI